MGRCQGIKGNEVAFLSAKVIPAWPFDGKWMYEVGCLSREELVDCAVVTHASAGRLDSVAMSAAPEGNARADMFSRSKLW